MNKKEFPALTGIRFIAASLVFFYHYAHELFAHTPGSFGYYFFRQLNVGVSIFFVLSGFLITYRYFSFTTVANLRPYIVKRVARILPLYYAVLCIQIILLYIHKATWPDIATVFLNITLLKGLSAEYFYSILTQTWTLTVEEMFYLYAPFCFFLIRVRNFFLLQVPVLLAIGFLVVWLSGFFSPGLLFESSSFMLSLTFFGRCFEFFIGIFLAIAIMKQPEHRRGIIYTFGGALLVISLLAVLGYYAFEGKIAVINDHFFGIVLFNFFIPIAIGLFYYGLLVENSFLKKVLGTKLIVLLGKSSYAFYLLHIGMLAEIIFFKVTSNIFLLFILLQVISIAAYKLYEKPVYFFLLQKFGVSAKDKVRKEKKRVDLPVTSEG